MIPLPADQVHLWLGPTDLAGAELERCRAVLDERELARAARFRERRHAVAHIAAHGWLRRVLAAYAGIAASDLRFVENRFGKPELAAGGEALRFNLSHAGRLAVVAISPGFAIGVDIERIGRFTPDLAASLAASLAPGEARALTRLPEALRPDGLACCWTRKEAYLKARGTGLSMPPAGFEVSVDPRAPARLISVAGAPGEAARWRLCDFAPAPGYRGAVAARHLGWSAILMRHPQARVPARGLSEAQPATAALRYGRA